jgi:DNA repair protein RecN (Recombination protein N)
MIKTNPGSPFAPLHRAASGGELARLMLAMRVVLAGTCDSHSFVFDEIDTGVSGEIANKMSDIMYKMGKEMQILSITHLPQIAAKGDQHFKVFKEDKDDVTTTHLKILNNEERVVEIAQMLGGKNVSEAAIANAKELLN